MKDYLDPMFVEMGVDEYEWMRATQDVLWYKAAQGRVAIQDLSKRQEIAALQKGETYSTDMSILGE